MNITKKLAALAVTAVAAASLGSTAAYAEVRSFADAKHDVEGGADLWRATVTHEKRVKVTLKFDNLVPDFMSDAGASLYVDTDKSTKGPDYVLRTGLFEGTDYAMFRTDGWAAVGEPLTCFHQVTLDYDRDLAKVVFGRGCLGDPDAVRIAVKSASSGSQVDWLGSRRHLSAWVAQG